MKYAVIKQNNKITFSFVISTGSGWRQGQIGNSVGGRREAGAFRPRHVLPGQKCEPGPSHISPVPPLHRGAVEGQGRQDCVRQKKGVSAGWLLKYSLELEKKYLNCQNLIHGSHHTGKLWIKSKWLSVLELIVNFVLQNVMLIIKSVS